MVTLPKNKKLPFHNEGRPKAPKPKKHGPQFEQVKPGNHKKGHGKNKKGGSGGGGFYGGRGGYKGVAKKKVRRLANGVINDEVRDLRKQKRVVNREARSERNRANTDYRRAVGDLKHVYGETSGYLKNLQSKNAVAYADQQANTAAANAALQAQLGNTYSGAQTGAAEELARLGITGGGNFGQLMSDQANAQAGAAQAGANASSTLGAMNANAGLLNSLIQGMNQGSYTSSLGKSINARNDALTEVRQNRIDQLNAVREGINDARAGRKDAFFQLMEQLQQTGWSQYMDQQNLKMQRKQMRFNQRQARKH